MTATAQRMRAIANRYRALLMSFGHGDSSDEFRRCKDLRNIEAHLLNRLRFSVVEYCGSASSISTTDTFTSGTFSSEISLPIVEAPLKPPSLSSSKPHSTIVRRDTLRKKGFLRESQNHNIEVGTKQL